MTSYSAHDLLFYLLHHGLFTLFSLIRFFSGRHNTLRLYIISTVHSSTQHQCGTISVPRIILSCILKQCGSRLNVCHANARSIFRKINFYSDVISHSDVSIFCVSETWLNNSHTDSMIQIPGYRVSRSDRLNNARGGGVCIFVSNNIKYKVLCKSAADSSLEYLLIEVTTAASCALVGVIYNPPRCNDMDALSRIIDTYTSRYSDVILVGDFNINLNQSNTLPIRELFLDVVNDFALHVVNRENTHFSPLSSVPPSCLDLFLVSNLNKVVKFNQLDIPLSDHDMIVLSYDLPFAKPPEEKTYSRNLKRINSADLLAECQSLEWDDIYWTADPEDQLKILNDLLLSLLEKFAPLREFKKSVGMRPSARLQMLTVDRDMAHKSWRRSMLRSDWDLFRHLHDQAATLAREETQTHHSHLFGPNLGSKELWRNINRLGIKDGHVSSPAQFESAALNAHFLGSAVRPSSLATVDVAGAVEHTHQHPFADFSFRNATIDEVHRALCHVKSSAVGVDGVPPPFIKMLLPVILPYITHLFNTILTTSKFPNGWKTSRVIPIPKVPAPASENDYRPISIVPFLSKAFEKIAALQMNVFLAHNRLLNSCQSGFRSNRSTSTALLNITDDIRCSLDRKHISLAVFLDFSKAFDNVDHSNLINKLSRNFNFSSSASAMLQSYLGNRQQFVEQLADISHTMTVTKGVPQGSVLGPLLFCLYINDLPLAIENATCSLYADDVQLLLDSSVPELPLRINHINADLASISAWADTNGLALNPSKSSLMVFARRHFDMTPYGNVTLNNIPLARKITFKNLGVWFDEDRKWKTHVSKVTSSVSCTVRRLWKIAWLLPEWTRIRLVKSLVMPILSYSITTLGKLPANLMQRLSVAFNSSVRFAFNLRMRSSLHPYIVRLLGLTLPNYFSHLTCCTMYKIITTREPDYLFGKLTFGRAVRTQLLILPRSRLKSYDGDFFIQGVKLWNSLPLLIRNLPSANAFRAACFQHFSSL